MRYLHTMVRVSDLEASLDFYCNKLGLVEVRRMENEKGRFTLVFLATPDDARRIKDEAKTELAAESPVIELTWNWDEPRDGHMAFIRSPDGISIELLQDGYREPKEPWASMPNTGSW
jgi:lactoylglutathione lyase